MDDILNAIDDLTEEARISGAHPDEPTNYKEAHAALMTLITAYAAQERAAALKGPASAVSRMFVNDPHAIHPDIAFDAMNEAAQTAAHSTAQNAARLILDLIPSEAP